MAEKYEGVMLSRKQIFFNNLLGGVAWAIGATIGFAILILVLGTVVSRINLIPIFGNFVSKVAVQALRNNPQLLENSNGR